MADKPTSIRADQYLRAAQERQHDAQILYDARRYAWSIYSSGVAVECILLAYQVRKSKAYDARHDLRSLYTSCNISQSLRINERERISFAVDMVAAVWNNSHRYRDDKAMKRSIPSPLYERKIRGDVVKYFAGELMEHSTEIVITGAKRWQ